ncbi:hypothetical protein BCV70DRAFT_200080 [Testicularia cyperi]|uniref:Brl1/Brr6 domain-containing protein n=1 Tax=Testicularia cyperi TaxID=1882483 RepID=A0A317XSS6_9BASI|nr:hypothetical protein BCV70DRAFT_200080 [Testicularia cyperi]
MSWYRGTEAPMDTSPAGPRQRSIFDADATGSWGQTASSSPVPGPSAASMAQDTVADVEMSSLTPPSHKPHWSAASNGIADESMEAADDQQHGSRLSSRGVKDERQFTSTAVTHRVRRKRSVLSRKGKRLAHLQSRELHPLHHSSRGQYSDDDQHSTDNDEDDDEDEDNEHDERDTPSRIRSITKYAINYVLPGGVGPTAGGPGASNSIHHLDRPEMLLGYAQLVFNASILMAFLYLLFHVVRTVQKDVAEKVRAYEMDTLSEITACASAYTANRCGTDLQAPALAAACKNWERCSARDPAVVGTARVTAETFAEILNGFVDAVSWKTMLFTLLTLSIVVGATNSTLSFFRIKSRTKPLSQTQQHASSSASTTSSQHPQQDQHPGAPAIQAPYPPYFHPAFSPHYGAPGHAYPSWQVAAPETPSRKRQPRSNAIPSISTPKR